MADLTSTEYRNWLASIKERIQSAQVRAALHVNAELIELYWALGAEITAMEKTANWGDKLIDNLTKDLMSEYPGLKGFSKSNLKYIKRWYLKYCSNVTGGQRTAIPDGEMPILAIGQQAVDQLENEINAGTGQQAVDQIDFALLKQIPWGHHIAITTKTQSVKEAIFYVQECIQNNWSRSVLMLQIESNLYERQGKAITNFKKTLPAPLSDLARETLKNPYNFDFLALNPQLKERDLEKGLIEHLKKFMLELGKGFAYVGNQFNFDVEGDDYFLDLLFYNTNLKSYVIFELKIGEFKPEYAGKLNFYVNAINDRVKGQGHNPTIGVLLCKTPNETVVKYSLQGIETPVGVTEYQLATALPREIAPEMPSIEEIEQELEKEIEDMRGPVEKRMESLKARIASLKTETIEIPKSPENIQRILNKSLLPLFDRLINSFNEFSGLFISHNYYWSGANNEDFEGFKRKWGQAEFHEKIKETYFLYHWSGFKKAGVEPFDIQIRINYILEPYLYCFQILGCNQGWPIIKKLYHQDLSEAEIEKIVETSMMKVLADIEFHINRLESGEK